MCDAKLCTLHFAYNKERNTRHIFRTFPGKETHIRCRHLPVDLNLGVSLLFTYYTTAIMAKNCGRANSYKGEEILGSLGLVLCEYINTCELDKFDTNVKMRQDLCQSNKYKCGFE